MKRGKLTVHLDNGGATDSTYDSVNRPAHYAEGRKYEPIAVIEDWGLTYHLGNAVKYISRAGRKGETRQDIEKAVWYLQRYLDEVCS